MALAKQFFCITFIHALKDVAINLLARIFIRVLLIL